MKNKFSTKWKSSKQPRKQRKYRANAPLHLRKKFVRVNLNKDLRKKYGKRNIQVRTGDKVKIMRGKFKGKQGKVGSIDIKNTRLTVDGVQRTKKGGEKLVTWFNPSKVKIIVLDEKDSKRLNKSKRTEKKEVKEEKTEAKKAPAKEIKKTAPSGVPSAEGKKLKKETRK